MTATTREEQALAIAQRMYSEISGADHKQGKADLTQEIYEWLVEGDFEDFSFEDLLTEWREFVSEVDNG